MGGDCYATLVHQTLVAVRDKLGICVYTYSPYKIHFLSAEVVECHAGTRDMVHVIER